MHSYTTEPGVSFFISDGGQIISRDGKSKLREAIRDNRGMSVMAISEDDNCVVSVKLDPHRGLVADYMPMSRKTIWSIMSSKDQARKDAMRASSNNPKRYAKEQGLQPGSVKYHSYLIEFDRVFNKTRKRKTIKLM
ncbi:hypothetical protein [Endozoicomonas montiporae]|uniref:Uncharacterized protein n=1 Tax=Endozoicomonas montiporae CL-33 TaxID=570277 RepID=A0A142BD60_9GAMM|nr:hypothetical protein [Endozoicomonas montiporae]AMO56686.1 hypothetical protein EZMO1_2614 [Endozoicomonas montiporae CL-33]